MGDDQGGARGEEAPQLLPQSGGDVDVERRHRLVQEQQPGIGGQGPGDRDLLGLPAGERRGPAVGELADAELGEPALRLAVRSLPGLSLCAQSEADVPAGREVREQHRVLRERGDLPLMRRHPAPLTGQHLPVEDDLSRGGAQRPRDQRQRRGLPGAVGADQREGLPVGHLELELDPALGDRGAQRQAHATTRRRATAMISTATIINTKDNATAASGSLSRCR